MQSQLQQLISDLLKAAKKKGASDAEAVVNRSQGLAVDVRMQTLETIENTTDQGLHISVYFGKKKAAQAAQTYPQKPFKKHLKPLVKSPNIPQKILMPA